MDNLRKKKLSKEQMRQLFKKACSDQRFKMARKLLSISDAAAQQQVEKHLAASKDRKLKAVERKKQSIGRCQDNHEGPILSVSHLDKIRY